MDEQLRLEDNEAFVALKGAWDRALALLAPEINEASFKTFVRTAKPLSADGKTCTIGASGELAKIFLDKYSHLLKPALEASLGREIEVIVTVAPKEPPKSKAQAVRQGGAERPAGSLSPVSQPLNDRYTFATFVTGPSNKLAHAAAKSVAESPGAVYNPFFLYGPPGLGKTHLLQAIGRHALEKHAGIRVAYVSGETFTSHYVTAIREHRSEDFRQKYRGIDLWLVDDVQFLADKPQTKEEFFHTFNALYQSNKQVVLCSDRPPRDLAPLEERLKSRFESGLVVDISPPDARTRIDILKAKVQLEKAIVPLPVLECVADLIPTNVRALEGGLVTLLAYSSLMEVPITEDLAREVLSRYLNEKNYMGITPDAVQRAVAKELGVEVQDMRSEKREKDVVLARHVAMYLARELTACSLKSIGDAFRRNHASVIHACSRITSLVQGDCALKGKVDDLAQGLKSGRLP